MGQDTLRMIWHEHIPPVEDTTMKLIRTDLTPACRRRVKELEAAHERTCRSVWEFQLPDRPRFLFGSFTTPRAKGEKLDRDVYTIAVWNEALYMWEPQR